MKNEVLSRKISGGGWALEVCYPEGEATLRRGGAYYCTIPLADFETLCEFLRNAYFELAYEDEFRQIVADGIQGAFAAADGESNV